MILGSLTYGGYYFGKKATSTVKPEKTTVNTFVETSISPSPVTIVAGLPKSAGLSFDQYSIMAPNDWISKKEAQTAMDERLILEKDGYSISIFQAATGGALCLYPGDAEFEGPVSKFEIFTDLTTKDNKTLRRGGNKNDTTFTICQKSADGSYQQPTNYGHISVKLPANYTPEILTEIDSIISSLKKI
jgi:hypothetical protein